MILGISYKDSRGVLVPTNEVEITADGPVRKSDGEKLVEFPAKMSKSLRNVVNPDDIIAEYGADSMRLYEMFMGALEAVKPWNTAGVEGVHRFLKRVFRVVTETPIVDKPCDKDLEFVLHCSIKKVARDIESFSFNTAISQLMVLTNTLSELKEIPREAAEALVQMLAPFAPHVGEELWEFLGHNETITYVPFPVYDEAKTKLSEVDVLVQVLGKPKAHVMMPAEADNDTMTKLALENSDVQAAIAGKSVAKVICVKGRLVNIVAK